MKVLLHCFLVIELSLLMKPNHCHSCLDLVEELKKGIEHGKPVIIDPTVEQMALLNGLMYLSTTILLYLSIRGFLIEYRFS